MQQLVVEEVIVVEVEALVTATIIVVTRSNQLTAANTFILTHSSISSLINPSISSLTSGLKAMGGEEEVRCPQQPIQAAGTGHLAVHRYPDRPATSDIHSVPSRGTPPSDLPQDSAQIQERSAVY